MSSNETVKVTSRALNGVDVDQVMSVIGAIEEDPGYARFQWRASNTWTQGAACHSRFKDFYAGNAEDTTREEAFVVEADEPAIAAGLNTAPNAMEYLLHALAACLTGTLVYHAAVRGIQIDAVESVYTGDMDVRGLFGMSEDVRKGFSKVTVEMRVQSEASVEELTEMALFSPVYDVVSNALPVEFRLIKQ